MPEDRPSILQRLRGLAARLFENNIQPPHHVYIHPEDLRALRAETGHADRPGDPLNLMFQGINVHPTVGAPEGTPLLVERDQWQYRWEHAERERQRLHDQTAAYQRLVNQMYGQIQPVPPGTYNIVATAAGTNEFYDRMRDTFRTDEAWLDEFIKPARPHPQTMREQW